MDMDIWIEQTKFHQIALKKIRISPLNPKECTIRNFLCYYQELACREYPNEAKMEKALLNLYDAKFSVFLSNYGSYSLLVYSLTAPDPHYIYDECYTIEILEQAFESFCIPKMNQASADKALFERAYEIYESDLFAFKENTAEVAYQNMISLYFKGTPRDYESLGNLKELKKITPKHLWEYYQKVIKEEAISIGTGNKPSYEHLPVTLQPKKDYFFRKRNPKLSPLIQKPYASEQCYLYMVYDLQLFADDPLYYAGCVFNQLMGGGASSYLFRILREELGLCYSIHSSYYSTMGILLISAVLDEKNVQEGIQSIENIIEHVNPTVEDLEAAKAYTIGLIQTGEDAIDTKIWNYLKDTYFLDTPKSTEKIESFTLVRLADVKKVLQKLKKSFVYILGGAHER